MSDSSNPQRTIDLDSALGKRATVSIEPEESPDERAARLKRESREAVLDLVKGYVLFLLAIVALCGIAAICVFEALFDATSSADTKRWAQTVLSALVAGLISFLLGQRSARAK